MAKKKVVAASLEDQVLQLKRELEEQKRKHECEIALLTKRHQREMLNAVAGATLVTVGMLEERLQRFRDEISTGAGGDIEDRLYRLERNALSDPDED